MPHQLPRSILRNRRAAMVAGLILVPLVACTNDDEPVGTERRSEPLRAAEIVDLAATPGLDRAAANRMERAAKRASAGPVGPTPVAIDWDEAAASPHLRDDLLTKTLPAAQRVVLERISLPALLPVDPTLLASAKLTHGALWYGASMQSGDGLNLYVHGTRGAFEIPGVEYPQAARDAADDYTLTRTHGILSIRFNAFGAAYSVDLECAEPTRDERCTGDDYGLTLVEALQIADASEAGGRR